MAQKEPNVIMDKQRIFAPPQVIVSNETPSWKGIEGRTGGPGWGAFGPGKDQEIIVSFNKNTTPCSSNDHAWTEEFEEVSKHCLVFNNADKLIDNGGKTEIASGHVQSGNIYVRFSTTNSYF